MKLPHVADHKVPKNHPYSHQDMNKKKVEALPTPGSIATDTLIHLPQMALWCGAFTLGGLVFLPILPPLAVLSLLLAFFTGAICIGGVIIIGFCAVAAVVLKKKPQPDPTKPVVHL